MAEMKNTVDALWARYRALMDDRKHIIQKYERISFAFHTGGGERGPTNPLWDDFREVIRWMDDNYTEIESVRAAIDFAKGQEA
jgi:hypothetical protein